MTNTKPVAAINVDSVRMLGGHILGLQLAAMRDPGDVPDHHLDHLADASVRAALAIEAAIPRAEERLAAEANAADDKAAAEGAAARAAEEKAAADAAAADAAAAAAEAKK